MGIICFSFIYDFLKREEKVGTHEHACINVLSFFFLPFLYISYPSFALFFCYMGISFTERTGMYQGVRQMAVMIAYKDR